MEMLIVEVIPLCITSYMFQGLFHLFKLSLLMPHSAVRQSCGCPVTWTWTIHPQACISANSLPYKVWCELVSNHFCGKCHLHHLWLETGEFRNYFARSDFYSLCSFQISLTFVSLGNSCISFHCWYDKHIFLLFL